MPEVSSGMGARRQLGADSRLPLVGCNSDRRLRSCCHGRGSALTSQVAPTRADAHGEVTPRAGTGECAYGNCTDPIHARQLCGRHYQQLWRAGVVGTRHGTLAGWSNHKKQGTHPCTECVKARNAYDKRRWVDKRTRRDATLALFEERLSGSDGADLSWRERGACWDKSPEWFMATDPSEIRRALQLCGFCKVVPECRASQAFYRAPGVWGGERWMTSTSAGLSVMLDERFSMVRL